MKALPMENGLVLDSVARRRLVAEALVAEGTLRRFLAGAPVRPVSRHRILTAMARLGLLPATVERDKG